MFPIKKITFNLYQILPLGTNLMALMLSNRKTGAKNVMIELVIVKIILDSFLDNVLDNFFALFFGLNNLTIFLIIVF